MNLLIAGKEQLFPLVVVIHHHHYPVMCCKKARRIPRTNVMTSSELLKGMISSSRVSGAKTGGSHSTTDQYSSSLVVAKENENFFSGWIGSIWVKENLHDKRNVKRKMLVAVLF